MENMSTTSDLIVALQTAEPWDIAHSEELHTLAAARLSELERENARLREALRVLSWHYEELATMDGDVSREQLQTHDGPLKQARAAQAGSEKP